jgi:rubredoxin
MSFLPDNLYESFRVMSTCAYSTYSRRKIMKKYRCTVCGYVYDPQNGDADGGVAAGTAFEDLPDGWCCPVCGAEKDAFEAVD